MKTIKLLEILKSYPTFKLIAIQRILNSNRNYAKTVVNRLLKQKYIQKVCPGTYTSNNTIDEISSNIVYPSYISGWYASYHKGYTDQIINKLNIFTTIKKHQIKFNNYILKFIKTKYMFGYDKINNIFIADDNKLLIDALLYPKEFGNFDEIINLVSKGDFNKNKITSYLKIINKQSVIKKVGYLLESYRQIDISSDFKLNNNYVVLNAFVKKYNNTNTKWRLKL